MRIIFLSQLLCFKSIFFSFNRPSTEIDKQFRLFLSSKSDNNFPNSLLKAGIKVKKKKNLFKN